MDDETQDSVSQEPEGKRQPERKAGHSPSEAAPRPRVRSTPEPGTSAGAKNHGAAHAAAGLRLHRGPGVPSASQQGKFRVGEEQQNTKLNKYLVTFFFF